MKRVILILCACVVLVALAACGKQDTPALDLDLDAVYQSILDAQGDEKNSLVLFEETVDGGYINAVYDGITDIAYKQFKAYVAPVSGFATEIVLAEVENSKDVDALKTIFQARIDAASADKGYPETAIVWKRNATVQENGNYVAMIVLSDEYTIPEDVFALAAE